MKMIVQIKPHNGSYLVYRKRKVMNENNENQMAPNIAFLFNKVIIKLFTVLTFSEPFSK
jgi:hypothetical protein